MDEPSSKIDRQESDIDISDLPGVGEKRRILRAVYDPPAFVRALAGRPRLRFRLWRTATVGLILALLFISLSGSFPQLGQGFVSLFAHPTPTPAVQRYNVFVSGEITAQYYQKKVIQQDDVSPPVVPVTATLDPVPQYCLQYTLIQAFDSPSLPPGVGSSPAWVTGFSGRSGQRAVLNHLKRAYLPQSGWYEQLQLVSETNYPGAIILHGGVDGSAMPLWFGTYQPGIHPRDAGLILTLIINPLDASASNHTTEDQQWNILPVTVYIAEAGCYYLKASWAGGSWTAYFMAGR